MVDILDDTEIVSIDVLEDFVTYEEHDPNGYLDVTANKITATGFTAYPNPTTYMRKDLGSAIENFDVKFKIELTAQDVAGFASIAFFCANPSSVNADIAFNNQDGVGLDLWQTTGHRYLRICEYITGTTKSWADIPLGIYHIHFFRTGQSVVAQIYGDEAMTNLLRTLSVIMPSYPCQYYLPVMSRGIGGTATIDFSIENLSIRQ